MHVRSLRRGRRLGDRRRLVRTRPRRLSERRGAAADLSSARRARLVSLETRRAGRRQRRLPRRAEGFALASALRIYVARVASRSLDGSSSQGGSSRHYGSSSDVAGSASVSAALARVGSALKGWQARTNLARRSLAERCKGRLGGSPSSSRTDASVSGGGLARGADITGCGGRLPHPVGGRFLGGAAVAVARRSSRVYDSGLKGFHIRRKLVRARGREVSSRPAARRVARPAAEARPTAFGPGGGGVRAGSAERR